MTKDEFWTWFLEHCQHFTSLGTWFSSLPADAIELGILTQAVVLGNWQEALSSVELQDAREATRQMFTDTSDVYFDRHPAHIRAFAAKIGAPRKIRERSTESWSQPGYNPTILCRECQDRAFRTIVRKESVEAIARGETGFIYTAAIGCGGTPSRVCQAQNAPRFDSGRRYEPDRHCLAEQPGMGGKELRPTELREWVKQWMAGARRENGHVQTEATFEEWQPAMSHDDAVSMSLAEANRRAKQAVKGV